MYNVIDKEERNLKIFFYFINNRMQTVLRLKNNSEPYAIKRNTVTNCYSVFLIDLYLRLSFFEVFNSNFNITKVLSQLSLKRIMYYRKTLFLCISKYF